MPSFWNSAKFVARRLPRSLVAGFGRPAAVFFHGVVPQIDHPHLQVAQHEAEAFDDIARALKANFDVLPIAALDEVMAHPERHRRSVFLMSDDGYANCLSLAADILADVGLPWTLFVASHHIDSGERLPTFLARLFVLFAPAGRYEIPHLGARIVLGDEIQRLAVLRNVVETLKALDAPRAQQTLDGMLKTLAPQLAALLARFPSESFLDWDGVKALQARGVTIGAHAHVHWPMHARQSGDFLRAQAAQSRTEIEQRVGPCRYFAYPFGTRADVSAAAWKAVRDAGFDYAFTTMPGTLAPSLNPYLLPRYFIRPEDRDIATLVPMLRAGNGRLRAWQRDIAD